jgi:hypothetical protein
LGLALLRRRRRDVKVSLLGQTLKIHSGSLETASSILVKDVSVSLSGQNLSLLQSSRVVDAPLQQVDAVVSLQGQVLTMAKSDVTVRIGVNVETSFYSALNAPSTVVYNPAPGAYTLPQIFLDTRIDTSYLWNNGNFTRNVYYCNSSVDVQANLNAAQRGDAIVFQDGVTFSGNFVLPAKSGSGWIYLMSQSAWVNAGAQPFWPEGTRVNPTYLAAAGWPKIITPNSAPVFETANSASCSHWRFVGLEISMTTTPNYQELGVWYFLNYGLVVIGAGATETNQPSFIYFDRCYIHGHHYNVPTYVIAISRALSFSGKSLAVIDSFVSDVRAQSQDTQAVGSWSGAGPFKIVNNYLEATGENILFGGANPTTYTTVPSDMEIRRNHLFKPIEWKDEAVWGAVSVKNLYEHKSGQRVLFEGNVCEHNWVDSQAGFCELHQVIDDSGGSTKIQDLTIRHNKFFQSSQCCNMAALITYAPPTNGPDVRVPLNRIEHYNNLYYDNGNPANEKPPTYYASSQRLLQLIAGVHPISGAKGGDWLFNHNTFLFSAGITGSSAILFGDPGPKIYETTLTNNIFGNSTYGVFKSSDGVGTSALNGSADVWTFQKNAVVLSDTGLAPLHPANNFYPTSNASLGLDSSYRPSVASGLRSAGTDGQDVGILVNNLELATGGVVQGYFNYATR